MIHLYLAYAMDVAIFLGAVIVVILILALLTDGVSK